MDRNRIGFWLLALGAAVLAACSTGGGGGIVVPQSLRSTQSALPSFFDDAHRRERPVLARVSLRVPAPRRHRHRGIDPRYISPGTASISFAVQPIAESGPRPTAMPLQTLNIATPSPCKTYSGSNGALVCSFTVSVMPGRDKFVVKTYSRRNAAGKLLSKYSSGPAIVPTPDPKGTLVPLGFTLEGVIDHVVLQYPNSVVPADKKGQVGAIPVGVATTAPLNVTPYDAANYQILSQIPATGTPVPYAAPFKLSVTPAGNGMTLINAKGSGSSVTISNPNDLTVTVDYSGVFTASGGNVSSATTFSVAATGSTLSLGSRKIDLRAPRAATPAPNAAGIVLSANAIHSGTVTTVLTSPGPIGFVNVPGTQNMAFFGYGYNNAVLSSVLGTESAGAALTSGNLSADLTGGVADSLGNLWAYDYDTGQIDCFASGSYGAPAGNVPSGTIVFPGGTLFGFIGFAADSSNNLWFTLWGSQSVSGYWYTIGYVPINATSCSAPAPVIAQATPTDEVATTGIAPIPAANGVAISSYDYTAGTAAVLLATKAVATPTVVSVPVANALEPLIGSPVKNYAIMNGTSAVLGSLSASGVFSPIATYPAALGAFFTQPNGSGSSASGVLGMSGYNGAYYPSNYVLLVDPTDSNPATNLEALTLWDTCQGVAFDSEDTAWTLCANTSNELQFYHIVPTATWSVLPGTSIPVNFTGCASPFTTDIFLSVLESFGATSGPFTLTGFNSNIISNVTPEGARAMAVTITEPTTGPDIEKANVVDSTGRTVPVTFNIDATYQACSPRRPDARAGLRWGPHARRGYLPFSRN